MIPHNLIRDSIGLCDNSPRWWEMWADIITRSRAFDDEFNDYWAVAERRGVPSEKVFAAFAPWPWDVLVGPDYNRVPEPSHEWSTGSLARYPYNGRGNTVPTINDACAVLTPEGYVRCNGACLSYIRSDP